MNRCLCIEQYIHVSPFKRLSASDCNFKCGGKSDEIYLGDCGDCGREIAYNVHETQGGILYIL